MGFHWFLIYDFLVTLLCYVMRIVQYILSSPGNKKGYLEQIALLASLTTVTALQLWSRMQNHVQACHGKSALGQCDFAGSHLDMVLYTRLMYKSYWAMTNFDIPEILCILGQFSVKLFWTSVKLKYNYVKTNIFPTKLICSNSYLLILLIF